MIRINVINIIANMERDDTCKEIEFCGSKLVVFQSGEIWRSNIQSGRWKKIENTANSTHGYNTIGFGRKIYKRHRIIGMVFLDLDINDPVKEIDHIDGNRLNNSLANLRIVSHHQNLFNKTKTKGYCWHKRDNKWMAQIRVNGQLKHLGYFDTETDASSAYLSAKLIHHQIV